jgi:hypothetical protein
MVLGEKRKSQDIHPNETRTKRPDHTIPATAESPTVLVQNLAEKLCKKCAGIDFNKLFKRKVKSRDGIFIRRIMSVSETSLCSLCRFFAAMSVPIRSEAGQKPQEIEYHLRAFSALQYFGVRGQINGLSDSVVLGVLPGGQSAKVTNDNFPVGWRDKHGFICHASSSILPTQSGFVGRRLSPTCLDYQLIKSWIDFCEINHAKLCGGTEKTLIPGFRVIDCVSREIISAPDDCQYVALSYVWGNQSSSWQCHVDNILPNPSPEVIEDAVEVVKQLDLRYLWIDRYCINQEDKDDKHNQICNMDSIYSNAKLTIIAAAGENPFFGLPGVRLTPRVPQPWVEVKNHLLVSSLPNPHFEIKNSKWLTRAWTYQEGLLSRRRLVFTHNQVYFQCMAMHCFESISMPLEALHTSTRERFRDDVRTHRAFPNAGVARRPEDFIKRINEYSIRLLSHESDILNAILGVLRLFQKMDRPTHHIWGIPIFPTGVRTGDSPFGCNRLAFGLAWDFERVTGRRYGFPSWSWVGWTGFTGLTLPSREEYYTYDVRIDIELNNGNLVEWTPDETLSPFTHNFLECSRYLHIWAWTLRLQFLKTQSGWTMIEPVSARYLPHTVHFTKNPDDDGLFQKKLEEQLWDGIVLGYIKRGPGALLKIIVVEREKGHFDRVGSVDAAFDTTFETCELEQAFLGDVRLERQRFRLG